MDGLRLRVLYRVFQRFAFRAVFVDLLHVRVDECEVVVIQVLIEEHLERACGGDALGASLARVSAAQEMSPSNSMNATSKMVRIAPGRFGIFSIMRDMAG